MKDKVKKTFGIIYEGKLTTTEVSDEIRKQLEESTWIIHHTKFRKGWGK